MEQTTLSVRVNSADKKVFEKFCKETGINVSTAINMFIKTVLREKKIPFEIKSDNFDDYVYDRLKEAEDELEKKSSTYSSEQVYNSLENIINDV